MVRRSLLLLVVLAPAAAADGPYRPFRDAAEKMVPRLTALAEWCGEKKLLVERAQVLEAVLSFDPDHSRARRLLGYQRHGTSWERRESWRPPRTTREEHRAEFARRRLEIADPFVQGVLREVGPRAKVLAGPDRERILLGLAQLLPDDARVRAVRGEVKRADRWVLVETAAARERGPKLVKRAREILAARPEPETVPPGAFERGLGIEWTAILGTGRVRAMGSVEESEIREMVRLSGAIEELFSHVFSRNTPLRPGFGLILLRGAEDRDLVLARVKGLSKGERARARKLGSYWLPSAHVVAIWSAERVQRTDSAGRQTLESLLADAFGIRAFYGALHEGLGLHLVYLLTGTRLTWFVKRSDYANVDPSFEKKLKESGADWLAAARDLAAEGYEPNYRILLGIGVNAMDSEDLVHAYALAVYLMEGTPPGWLDFLAAVGGGKPPAEASLDELGWSLGELERRVLRWLDEMKGE